MREKNDNMINEVNKLSDNIIQNCREAREINDELLDECMPLNQG